MQFSVGDKVSFLNEKGGGIVSKINNKKMVTITTTDGFDMPYLVNELVLVEKSKIIIPQEPELLPEVPKISEEELKASLFQKYKPVQSPKKSKPHQRNLVMEIDLHIEELVDDTRGMSNLQIINTQIRAFQNALDAAILNKYHKLIVIHGVGNGVLKNEICKIVKNSYELDYADASLAMYGKGATQIFVS